MQPDGLRAVRVQGWLFRSGEDGILQLLHRKLEPYPPILKLEKPRNGGPNHSEPPTLKRVTAISPEP